MLNKKVEEALNAQINAEMWSAYLYLSMSAYCHSAGYNGMASWFEVQFKEEQDHAQILFNYVNSRGGRVLLKPIDAVPSEWASPLDVFEQTLETSIILRFYPFGYFGECFQFRRQTILRQLDSNLLGT